MQKRTFEVLAKYIAKANRVSILFDADGGAYADLKKRVIHLPKEIGKRKVFAALALLMHEAAHLAHSTEIPLKALCSDEIDHSILNAVEDARIDKKNFNILPNVNEFYRVLLKDFVFPLPEKAPFEHKVLITALLENEYFHGYPDNDVHNFIAKHRFNSIFKSAEFAIECKDWRETKKYILEMRNLLYPKTPPGKGPKLVVPGEGQEGQGEGQGQGAAEGQRIGGIKPSDLDKILRPGDVFSPDGDSLEGSSASGIGEIAFEEKTIQEFKNLLSIKEKKVISNGTTLDTDNLVAFLTGDVDNLFKEEKHERKKKSKIFFLLDASGSMGDRLLDKQPRYQVVAKCTKKLTEVLQEVIELEGLNVDWRIAMFQGGYHPLEKDSWEKKYYPGGGTNLARAFKQALIEMKKDYETEGKKIVIVFSDGDIDVKQINEVKADILASGDDIRCLIVGVGTSLTGSFAQHITGDKVIIAEDNANNILIDCIREML